VTKKGERVQVPGRKLGKFTSDIRSKKRESQTNGPLTGGVGGENVKNNRRERERHGIGKESNAQRAAGSAKKTGGRVFIESIAAKKDTKVGPLKGGGEKAFLKQSKEGHARAGKNNSKKRIPRIRRNSGGNKGWTLENMDLKKEEKILRLQAADLHAAAIEGGTARQGRTSTADSSKFEGTKGAFKSLLQHAPGTNRGQVEKLEEKES